MTTERKTAAMQSSFLSILLVDVEAEAVHIVVHASFQWLKPIFAPPRHGYLQLLNHQEGLMLYLTISEHGFSSIS